MEQKTIPAYGDLNNQHRQQKRYQEKQTINSKTSLAFLAAQVCLQGFSHPTAILKNVSDDKEHSVQNRHPTH